MRCGERTNDPEEQDSATAGVFHHGQFTPFSQLRHGSSHVPATMQLPCTSGQKGGMHSQPHLARLNMPLTQAAGSQSKSSAPSALTRRSVLARKRMAESAMGRRLAFIIIIMVVGLWFELRS